MINKRTLVKEYGFKPFGNTKTLDRKSDNGKKGEFIKGSFIIKFKNNDEILLSKFSKGINCVKFESTLALKLFKTTDDIALECYLKECKIYKKLKIRIN